MNRKLYISYFFWIVGCLIISGFIGWLSASHITGWYQTVQKPWFNPPAWIFSPVWTVLYITIGIAGGYLWHYRKQYKLLFLIFFIQLLFNFSWSFFFFIGQSISWAFIDIIALWLSLSLFIKLAFKQKTALAWLLLPYLIWVSFAMVLNYFIWQLN